MGHKGYMYIKANPVFHLEADEWEVIEMDFMQFRQRIGAKRQLFTEEIVGSLVRILLYDMWNIYSREIEKFKIDDITGRPASDWIESYTAKELVKLLNDQTLTLTQIVDEMHFSSQAMLTRYLKRTLGKTPSEYRKGLKQE